jgi:acyl-CoA thioester hydrolase
MNEKFVKTFQAGWGMMDFNAHMRNTAYLDLAADTRMMFFEENGFSMRDFENLNIGPVVSCDEMKYYREFRLLETITVELVLVNISDDGIKFTMKNIFYRKNGAKAAEVTSTGAWMNLRERKLVTAPQGLLDVMRKLPSPDIVMDYEELKVHPISKSA